MKRSAGHTYDGNQVNGDGNHFGDRYVGTTINSKVAALEDYSGLYAHNALATVSTYIDRANLTEQLKQQLHDHIDHIQEKTRIVVVHGIGGTGKTQLVLNYVEQYRQDYSAVFWVEAGSHESIRRDFLQIYYLLYNIHHAVAQQASRVEDAVPAVKRWFYNRNKRWLFVFDSADNIVSENDPSGVDLRSYLPDAPSIHVIITTRDRTVQRMTKVPCVEVGNMTAAEASALLKVQSELHTVTTEQEKEIGRIVHELGYLALAITLAGSYIAATPRLQADITQYLPAYETSRKETTYQAIEARNATACRFLALLSFLNEDDIFLEFAVLDQDNDKLPWTLSIFPQTTPTTHDVENLFRVLEQFSVARFRVLEQFSVARFRADQGSYSMHKLVSAWAYDRLSPEMQREYGISALQLLGHLVMQACTAGPVEKQRLVPHLITSFDRLRSAFQADDAGDCTILDDLDSIADFLTSCGHFRDAFILYQFVFKETVSQCGNDHLDTITSMGNLAITLGEIGEHQEALRMRREVLEKRRKILGEEHPDTIKSINNLAIALNYIGEYQEALKIRREVVKKRRRILGEEHPDTITSINNLAVTLNYIGEHQEALHIIRQVVEKRRRILGEEHPETILSISNLAITLSKVGELQEALKMKREVVEKRRRILGEEHPYTISSMNNLANTLGQVGELQEALRIQREVVEKRRRILGGKHPDTITSIHNLAVTLHDVGELQEALRMKREVVEKRRRILGEEHPDTIMSISNLAVTLGDIGELQEALRIQREVVKKFTHVLGGTHPKTVAAIRDLRSMADRVNAE